MCPSSTCPTKLYMICCAPVVLVHCGSVPRAGPGWRDCQGHLAGNKEEFSTLLRDALTVKAALLLNKDDMISHLCIRCMCSYDAEGGKDPPAHEGTTTFVELASSILESQSSDAEEVPSVLRASLALSHMSSNIRVAAAQVCSSALTYLLADGFCHTSLWLGCLSPSTTDLDANINTLKTLERVNHLTIANDWTLEPTMRGFLLRQHEPPQKTDPGATAAFGHCRL